MPRNPRKARRLVVDGDTYTRSVRHSHGRPGGGERDCCESLTLHLTGARGHLRVVFREGPGRLVPTGYPMVSGEVSLTTTESLYLHEPGTVRALMEEALARGWRPDGPSGMEIDGWTLFEAALRRRKDSAGPPPAPQA
ncbi:hypothetical protein ABZY83_11115 [Streptomyces virginiae]|uniref:hypothetical protein n=1 Tax=Streptomyces TaxID=1883 RepID=UPI0006ADF2F6|nr:MULTISPECIES: hypothetical protein [unclassified Streptomyces]KOU91056.1 hypothetical protein ADK93_08180 [Streptomyces sp. XY58]KOV12835.1 hypothetical protein ADK89_01160 [Streptomyces sp. XY37]KOV56612.1 hypothetical protein ADK99_00910 [Streptomyces sp. MMG1064]